MSRGGRRTHKITRLSGIDRIVCLRAALPVSYPCAVKLQVRVSHPAVRAYEAQLSTGSPASDRFSDQGESRTPMPCRHDVLSVACLPIPPLGHDRVTRTGIEPILPA